MRIHNLRVQGACVTEQNEQQTIMHPVEESKGLVSALGP